MLNAINKLLESDLVNDETKVLIQEEWDKKMEETRETIRAELREEFANRYEHDKETMVDALESMVTEGIKQEIEELAQDKQAMRADRVGFQQKMAENIQKVNEFMTVRLAEEIKELRKDRKMQTEGFKKLDTFISESLTTEINEFAQDKRALVEAKVRLVAEAKEKLSNLKDNFIAESSQKVKKAVTNRIHGEISQLHEDIKVARENDFGRRIYEAFSTEFLTTHLNESSEIRKLRNEIDAKANKLSEAKKALDNAKVLIESKDKEVRMIAESNHRAKVMDDLLGPLADDKADIMRNLLENVQTSRLQGTFDKYLPAVLENKTVRNSKKTLTESKKEVTGNKTDETAVADNVVDIKRLAGL